MPVKLGNVTILSDSNYDGTTRTIFKVNGRNKDTPLFVNGNQEALFRGDAVIIDAVRDDTQQTGYYQLLEYTCIIVVP